MLNKKQYLLILTILTGLSFSSVVQAQFLSSIALSVHVDNNVTTQLRSHQPMPIDFHYIKGSAQRQPQQQQRRRNKKISDK